MSSSAGQRPPRTRLDPWAHSTLPGELQAAGPSPGSNELERFVFAQDPAWDHVLEELRDGAKRTHWMWFVFPQLRGLGRSDIARRFGIVSLTEARAYVKHPLLGPRLAQCCEILQGLEGRTALAIFGSVDELKLRSSLTLFERAAPDEPVFTQLLEQYFAGQRDAATLALLENVRSG
jgi:uncharacterized protein (DUF1810 family)